MRVLYFGTYERPYPRNAQTIAALRGAGVEVVERHVAVWDGREHKYALGWRALPSLMGAELRLLRRPREDFDAVLVGYPGHADVLAARRVAAGRPVVFNPLVSLADTFVADRARFGSGSLSARLLALVDRRALRSADLVVADTAANARFLAELAGLPPERMAVCFVGAEERVFRAGWSPTEPFTCLFVGKLIPLHGIDTVLAAAARLPDVHFRIIGTGQLEGVLARAPANVERTAWVDYERLPSEYRRAGCALGVFGTSAKAHRVIPNKVFQALACAVPVITGDTPAARELLYHGENALLVPPGDGDALAAAVERLQADPAFAGRLAAAGRRAYDESASERVLGQRWRAVLESALAARAAPLGEEVPAGG